MDDPDFIRCPACKGRGYFYCDCHPCDCICGEGEEDCQECDGTGLLDPDDEDDFYDPAPCDCPTPTTCAEHGCAAPAEQRRGG